MSQHAYRPVPTRQLSRLGPLLLMATGLAACMETPVAPRNMQRDEQHPQVSAVMATQANWYVRRDDGGATTVAFGLSTDTPVQRDYDGDAKADVAVFRAATATWYILASATATTSSTPFGLATDLPVPGDYDGDGKADLAVYRPSTGQWWYRSSLTSAVNVVGFGNATDTPVPADYDGDAKTDIAIFRASTGEWWIRKSATGTVSTIPFGLATDTPIPSDFDGDGKADLAVFRASTNEWWVNRSLSGTVSVTVWGTTGDTPVPGDYDGDAKADHAIFRPSTQQWWILRSSSALVDVITFGLATDAPVPARWAGTALTQIAVFRGEPAPPPPPQPQAIVFTSVAPAFAPVGATYAVSATGGGSGNPVTFSSLTPGTCAVPGSMVSFTAIGACSIAADQTGNASYLAAPRVTQQVTVTYAFAFSAPTLEAPAVNAAPKTSAVPVAFTLGGSFGLGVLASGTPRTSQVSCAAPFAALGPLTTADLGGGGITYAAPSGVYSFKWKVDKNRWGGTCRVLIIELTDGSHHRAVYAF